jgi:aldehyde dehydrogenase (NAD+)
LFGAQYVHPMSRDEVRARHREAIDEATTDFVPDHWVGGESVEASTGERFETTDPAVTEPIVSVARGDEADVNAAVAAADAAADAWGERTPMERAGILREWAGVLESHREELALLESLDTGKPREYAASEVDDAVEYVQYYAGVAQAQEGSHLPQGPDNHVYVRREPYGVAGQILPWNYPIDLFAWKAGAALAAGNAVVAKPSEEAPLSITRAAQLSAGVLPDGVLNVVNGYGEEAGAPLTEHADVDKLSFTGSVPVGQTVMHAAADSVTPVTLELGGKSPYVVFPDADLERAAETSAAGLFYNTGQSCDACSRVLVHEDVHDEFVDLYVREAEETWRPGDPLVEGTTMGPMTFADQLEKTSNYVDVGEAEGAELVSGGQTPDDDALADGYFFEPTVFDGVDNDMRIAQEEIFGPVQSIITFSDYDEAIRLANDVQYGLASGVATTDASRAHRAAADIDAGSVWVNEYHGGGPGIPFGGYKYSGIGRECAEETLEEYTHSKAVNVALDP